jgi:transposase
MARYQTYTVEFKRQVAEEHLGAGTSLNALARRHDISRELLRIRVRKHEAGEFAGDGPPRADRRAYEAKIAGLERKVGQLTMELDLLKRGLISARRARGAKAVLGGDCGWGVERRCCSFGRRPPGGRRAMVPEGRRHGASDVHAVGQATVRPLSFVCRARGDRSHAGTRPPDAAGGSSARTRRVDDLS